MPDIDRRGAKWVARWRDGDGKQRWKSFDRKLDAERFLTGVRADLQRGTYLDPKAGAVSLREYATERWLPAQLHVRANTAATYRSHLETWIVPLLGDRRVGAIKRTDCTSFVAALSAQLAPSTVATVYAVLTAVMGSARADGLIPANPCSGVSLPRKDKRVVEPLPAEAVLTLAGSITARYELAVWLAAGLGLREGEALGLTAARIDFLRRSVHVVEQMQNRQLSPLKTKASQRVIPADDLVVQQISAHMEQWPPGEHGVLITNRMRRPVQRNSFGHCWREAVRDAGLPAGTRFHDLRHFYASALIAAGTHPKVVQERLGHATIAETMDTYGHLFPAAAELGRGVLDAALSGAHNLHTTAAVLRSTSQ
jgi:integrase